jgi:electron transport complex protein RnfE
MKGMKEFINGLWKEHPTFRLLLGMCPTMAVSTKAINAIGMGASVIFVLVGSNFVISLIRKIVPDSVRIPIFIVVISTFVTVVDLCLHGFAPEVWRELGIFIPLIVVNCIILARAEAFAQKAGILESAADGLGMGIGFTWGLLVLGSIREILGAGTLFGMQVLSKETPTAIVIILPAGGFISLGLLIGLMNKIESWKRKSS